MATVILDDILAKRLRTERAASGGDRYDEVWEGTYMMAPMPNSEHQEILNGLATVFQIVIGWSESGPCLPGNTENPIVSEVLSLTFQLHSDRDGGRPRLQVTDGESERSWTV